MSRGLGRWQRPLLHELYHNPNPPILFPGVWISPRRFAATDSENSAVYRAARGLIAKGLARGFSDRQCSHTLYQVTPAPDITCPQCGHKCSELRTPADNSEHLKSSVDRKCSELGNAVQSSEHLQPPLRWVAT
jgi:hypothetical protein